MTRGRALAALLRADASSFDLSDGLDGDEVCLEDFPRSARSERDAADMAERFVGRTSSELDASSLLSSRTGLDFRLSDASLLEDSVLFEAASLLFDVDSFLLEVDSSTDFLFDDDSVRRRWGSGDCLEDRRAGGDSAATLRELGDSGVSLFRRSFTSSLGGSRRGAEGGDPGDTARVDPLRGGGESFLALFCVLEAGAERLSGLALAGGDEA